MHCLRTLLAFIIGTLLREADAAAPHLAECDHEEEFDFGLMLLIDALESRLGQSAAVTSG